VTVRDSASLRRGLLAVTVLHDLDLIPADDGAWLPLSAPLLVRWEEWAAALDGADPETPFGHGRLARYARARMLLGTPPTMPPRPFAAPVGHPAHPGPGWVRSTVRGGILDLGLGIAGLVPGQPDKICPLPAGVGSLNADQWFETALDYLEQMATLAVARYARRPSDPLRPMGDCDVVTLFASRTFRTGLLAGTGGTGRGLRTAAAPMRTRGWLDLRRIDPEFVACAARATEPEQRGFARPLLVTADELLAPRA
jgi:hypothetical protein